MRVLGMQKLTLLDYPGHVGAVLFLDGCNFRCPFCQNSSLVLSPQEQPEIPFETLEAFLKKRSGILEGICVTGGEPTIHRDLPEFLAWIRSFGYLVKLDTNGTNPAMLARLLQEGTVDYVAMDIKAGRRNYGRACGLAGEFAPAHGKSPEREAIGKMPESEAHGAESPGAASPNRSAREENAAEGPALAAGENPGRTGWLLRQTERSIGLLRQSSIEYEFRTTVVRGIHSSEDFTDIADWLAGSPRYFLQSFRDDPEVLLKNHPFSAFSEGELRRFLEILHRTIPEAKLRGV